MQDYLTESLLILQNLHRTEYLEMVSNNFPTAMLEGSTLDEELIDDDGGDDGDITEKNPEDKSLIILYLPLGWFVFYFLTVDLIPFVVSFWRTKKSGSFIPDALIHISDQHVHALFTEIDVDGDNKIDVDELQPMLEKLLSRPVSIKEVKKQMRDADANHDNELEFPEFLKMVRNFEKEVPLGMKGMLFKHFVVGHVHHITEATVHKMAKGLTVAQAMEQSAKQDTAAVQSSLNPRDRKMLERVASSQTDIMKTLERFESSLAALSVKLDKMDVQSDIKRKTDLVNEGERPSGIGGNASPLSKLLCRGGASSGLYGE